MPSPDRRLKLLVLSRNYPNNVLPLLGLWTQRLVESVTEFADVKVVAPVPLAPPRFVPARWLPHYARFRDIQSSRWDGPVEVFHPRLLTGPGHSLYALEALTYLLAVWRTVDQIRHDFQFDLIHAHFTYPDGAVAAFLGRRYSVPTVITEHTLWLPWMNSEPLVRPQAKWAVGACDAHLSVSGAVRRHVTQVVGPSVPAERLRVVPNVVDGRAFAAAAPALRRIPGQILFVGVVRAAKGVDILLRALVELRQRRPDVKLVLAGDPFYRSYQLEAARLHALAIDLGVADIVRNVGGQSPADVAQLMAESSVVVLPSRRESFGTVLIEAMACGTPVVATRCGGPEEVVTPEVGQLVAREDPAALAAALAHVLDHPEAYDPTTLRRSALMRFGRSAVGRQLYDHYTEVLNRSSAGALERIPFRLEGKQACD